MGITAVFSSLCREMIVIAAEEMLKWQEQGRNTVWHPLWQEMAQTPSPQQQRTQTCPYGSLLGWQWIWEDSHILRGLIYRRSSLTVSKAFGRSTKPMKRRWFCSLHFSGRRRVTKIMSMVLRFLQKPDCALGRITSVTASRSFARYRTCEQGFSRLPQVGRYHGNCHRLTCLLWTVTMLAHFYCWGKVLVR